MSKVAWKSQTKEMRCDVEAIPQLATKGLDQVDGQTEILLTLRVRGGEQ
jgi:hypothetical protein